MRPACPRPAALAALACLALAPRPGRAQTNVEPLRTKLAAKPVAAQIEASLNGSVGNVEGVVAGGAAQVATASGPHFAFVYGRGDFARFNDRTTIARAFGHARYNYNLTPRLWYEAFAQVQSDLFQRLRVRNLWGTGPRYAIYEAETFHAFVGLAYMFEYEVIDRKDDSYDPEETSAHRLSTYLSLSYAHLKVMTAGITAYLQPRIDAPSDARSLIEAAASFAITPTLASKLSLTLRYDSDPPTGVRPYDAEVKNSLTLTF
ncbi:MAG TPA: DUF481 domain-containing protein [Polyangiaceae bacterium]|nr:DUF481 domain-containing protein [Polyangiaceae bacterium]